MEVPEYYQGQACEVIQVELSVAILRETAERRRSKWAVILGLRPYRDGNSWCVLYGPDIQEGICAFGNTPEGSIEAFDLAMVNSEGSQQLPSIKKEKKDG